MNLSDPIYHDANKAREHLESLLWPDGAVCPHCGVCERGSKISGGRPGLYFCNACREQYTVTVGTVFERSKIPLNKWVLATHLMSASKTGVSAHQLHRMLGLTYKSAWFMCHRIREAMKITNKSPMGGEGEQVQADETYQGNTSKRAKGYKKGHSHKQQVVALVDPVKGHVRAFHVKNANMKNVREILVTNVDRKSTLVTDESRLYFQTGAEYADHQTVKHAAGNYVNKKGFHTNNVENFFGVFKRSLKAHIVVSEQHLNRYVAESAFRYSNRQVSDFERAKEALKGIEGKRLTYRRLDQDQDGQAAL
jgi:transposase-like protein